MTAAKSERLLNLVILLLVARNYTTKEQIRELMEPYRASSDEAFDRMFERDKDDLRALGIPLEVGFVDKFFEDEQGYRIKRDAFELPAIDFAADEVAVLGLAARVWRHAGLAAATSDALVKLKAAGLSFDREQLEHVQPTLAAEEPAFEAMWQATVHRTARCSSTTAGPASATPPPATSSPGAWSPPRAAGTSPAWTPTAASPGCSGSAGSSRPVTSTGEPGSYTVPEGTDLRALSQSLTPRQPDRSAVVLARTGAANGLRRRAEVSAPGVTGPDGTAGLGPARGALRLGDRLRRRAPRVRRRGGRRVTRRAPGSGPRRGWPASSREPPDERGPRAGLATARPGALPADAGPTCPWHRSPPTSGCAPTRS